MAAKAVAADARIEPHADIAVSQMIDVKFKLYAVRHSFALAHGVIGVWLRMMLAATRAGCQFDLGCRASQPRRRFERVAV
jgi:hypothetical protein